MFKYNKKQQDRKIEELNSKIDQMELVIREKDREIKMQALKIKEILNTEKKERTNLIKSEFNSLSKLASPNIHRRGISQISDENMIKLDKQRDLDHRYGRVNPTEIKMVTRPMSKVHDYLPVL